MTTARRTRVLVLDHTAALGGAELALVRLCEALPDDVAVRALLLSDGPLVRRLRSAGVRTDVLEHARAAASRDDVGRSWWRVVAEALASVRVLVTLHHHVRRLRPDVLYTTSLKADLLGAVVAATARVPLVWHVHDRIAGDYLPGPLVRLVRTVASVAPRVVVANSLATAATLPRVRRGVVVHPGYAPDDVRDAGDRALPDPPVVGLLGRISPTKGQLELVRAAAIVRRTMPRVRFRIVGAALFGETAYAEQVAAEIAAAGLEDVVELAGFTSDPRAELDTWSVCVHASPVPEPFGQVVLEAALRGVPVIATRAGGVVEILRDGGDELGVLVPPGDHEALAEAILDVLADPATAAVRAKRAWASAVDRFPVTATASRLAAVWRWAAAPAPRASH